MTYLRAFGSAASLLVLIGLGALAGLVAKAAGGLDDAGWAVAAGLGAVGGIAVHVVGTGLMWVHGAVLGVRRLAQRGR